MKSFLLTIALLAGISEVRAGDEAHSKYVLTVTGAGKAKVHATQADVQLAVKVEGKSALEVQQVLARRSGPVIDAIKRLNGTQVEAGSMSIYPQYARDNANVVIGYQGQNTISFSASVDKAGELIDSALAAGANELQSVTVHPEDETMASAREQALKDAAVAALREAKAVMDALGLKQKGIVNVAINPVNAIGYPRNAFKAMSVAAHEATQVLDEEQNVDASVTIELSFEP